MVETIYTIHGCPLRLALLTDLHNKDCRPAIASVRAYNPDIIAIAGDVIYGSRPNTDASAESCLSKAKEPLIVQAQTNVLPFLKACTDIAPTYFSLGNHEYLLCDEDLHLIRSTGVTLLENTFTCLPFGKDKIVIGGLSSAYVNDYRRFKANLPDFERNAKRYPRETSLSGAKGITTASERIPDTAWLTHFAAVPGYHILLSHHPEYFRLIPDQVELVLSGHAHGGQWRYWSPRTRRMEGLFAPGQGLWPALTSGIHDGPGGGHLVISRGLANTAKVPRINNPVEVVFIQPSAIGEMFRYTNQKRRK